MTTACPRAPRVEKADSGGTEKNNKLILGGEDKKEKQHKLRMKVRNVCISIIHVAMETI